MRGWFSYPVESEELLLDGATAIAAGVGHGVLGRCRVLLHAEGPARLRERPLRERDLRFPRRSTGRCCARLKPQPQAGILVGDQTIDWYSGKHFVAKAYENAYHGAYQLLKANELRSEPFLDWLMTPELLAQVPA